MAGKKHDEKVRTRKYTYQCREVSSYKIFNRFVKVDESTGEIDASQILSPACYDAWVKSRRKKPKKPQEAFRRALTAHCRGVDGRKPFTEGVERSLLVELRRKKPWACFENCKGCGSIGVQGFPSQGYHEKEAQEKSQRMQKLQKKRGLDNNVTNEIPNAAASALTQLHLLTQQNARPTKQQKLDESTSTTTADKYYNNMMNLQNIQNAQMLNAQMLQAQANIHPNLLKAHPDAYSMFSPNMQLQGYQVQNPLGYNVVQLVHPFALPGANMPISNGLSLNTSGGLVQIPSQSPSTLKPEVNT